MHMAGSIGIRFQPATLQKALKSANVAIGKDPYVLRIILHQLI